jgi:three-Cys-motif partner protein
MKPTDEGYCEGDDGLIAEEVGEWAQKKLKLLADYIGICGAVRRDFKKNQPSYIDVFCGPGRSKIRDRNSEFIDGSPVVAFRAGQKSLCPFHSIHISDLDVDLLAACEQRLQKIGAPVVATDGPAVDALRRIVATENKYGFHFLFLDPRNLGTLSFELFKIIATLKHVDVLVHVSLLDLQRNQDRYTQEDYLQFEEFAPNWRDHVNLEASSKSIRAQIISYWRDKVSALGLPPALHYEKIRGSGGQPLYWLMLLSKNSLAHKFWSKISSDAREPKFDFGDS